MKICFVIPTYSRETSDHFRYLYLFIEKLAQKHEVVLIAENGDDTCAISNIKEYYVQSSQNVLFRVGQRVYWFCKLRVKGYKTYYCHYCEISTIILSLLSKFVSMRVFKWHCSQQHLYTHTHIVQKILQELPVTLALRLAGTLITCSPQMKQYFQDQYQRSSNHIKILPNYICLKDFKPRLKKFNPKSQYRLLYVHRLSPRKGGHRLISLAQEIQKKKLNLVIDVVGDGPLYKKICQQIKELKLTKIIILHGSVPNDQIGMYYQKADVFIMPSREEEFGRVQLEAMYYGLPIIATETISSDYVLNSKQRKLVVKQNQYLSIISLANKLVKAPSHCRDLVSIGYQQLQKFSLEEALTIFEQEILVQVDDQESKS